VSRERLPDRRGNNTCKVTYTSANGKETKLLITLGYDDGGRVKEIFCADFKAGSDYQAIVMDVCILLSRLLQHGDTPEEIVASLTESSLVRTLVQTACELKEKQC
jgi:hypothetical protein